MSTTPVDFLKSAELLAQGVDEVDWRNAVSRAYYSAYHGGQQCVDLCPDNSNLRMGSHERLADRFNLHGTRGAKSIAIILASMKRYRHAADYETKDDFEKTIAENQVSQAKVILEKLASFEDGCRTKLA